MTKTRSNVRYGSFESGVQIDVYLLGVESCFHCCQHLAAVVTDLATGRKFDIEYRGAKYTVYPGDSPTPLEKGLARECCVRRATLYSSKNFDAFVEVYSTGKFSEESKYNFCGNNCADAVKSAIDYFCPEREGIETFCCMYKLLCCSLCIGSLALKCFPSLFCSTPSDIFDLALVLACTGYGNPPVTAAEYKHASSESNFGEPSSGPSKTPLLSDKDNVSVSVVTTGRGPALLAQKATVGNLVEAQDLSCIGSTDSPLSRAL